MSVEKIILSAVVLIPLEIPPAKYPLSCPAIALNDVLFTLNFAVV